MKKWFSSALFDFRWKKMTKGQRAMMIASFVLMGASAIALCVGMTACSDCEISKYASIYISFLLFAWSVPFISETMQAEGRINQKYLSEMNEIRKSLGRKEWEDI